MLVKNLFITLAFFCLQAEGLGELRPGQGGLATPPWVIDLKQIQAESLTAIVPDSRLAAFQANARELSDNY